MQSRDNSKYELCTLGLTEEEAISNAIKKIEENLWGSFGYKVIKIKYIGENSAR